MEDVDAPMDFLNRIKKEMTEGMVRGVLEHAGYFVTDFGIEKIVPGLSSLTQAEYLSSPLPDALRTHPDFIVRTRDQRELQLVEVKYRQDWGAEVLDCCREQVRLHRALVLVSINAGAGDPRGYDSPARFLRACRLRWQDERLQVELRTPKRSFAWHDVEGLSEERNLWWQMTPLSEIFPQLNEQECKTILRAAVEAIRGILDTAGDRPASNLPQTAPASDVA